MENRIKEQQLNLFADRTSTHHLYSNQLRLYFASFAYVLLHTLRRLGLVGTELAQAQAGTIRLKLLKLGARVTLSVPASGWRYPKAIPGKPCSGKCGNNCGRYRPANKRQQKNGKLENAYAACAGIPCA